MDKEKFYNDVLPFVESGAIREVYSSDVLSICNIANQCYAVFTYVPNKSGPGGIMIDSEQVMKIVSDDRFLSVLLQMDKKTLISRSFRLNKEVMPKLLYLKQLSDVNGPSSDIDFAMEEELIKKQVKNK